MGVLEVYQVSNSSTFTFNISYYCPASVVLSKAERDKKARAGNLLICGEEEEVLGDKSPQVKIRPHPLKLTARGTGRAIPVIFVLCVHGVLSVSTLLQVTMTHSFLNNILLYEHTTFYLFILLSMGIWVVSSWRPL